MVDYKLFSFNRKDTAPQLAWSAPKTMEAVLKEWNERSFTDGMFLVKPVKERKNR